MSINQNNTLYTCLYKKYLAKINDKTLVYRSVPSVGLSGYRATLVSTVLTKINAFISPIKPRYKYHHTNTKQMYHKSHQTPAQPSYTCAVSILQWFLTQ